MRFLFFLIAAVLFHAVACKNDGAESVREIRSAEGPNSSIVRNPVSANLPADSNQLARIAYLESEFDYGEVSEGDIVEHEFKFINTGNVPLTILHARSSCGCTIPDWPKEAIAPGASGIIKARFNTEGKVNIQRKIIYVTANTYPNETRVILKGRVKAK
ncbi:MAG: DUF1573 domain-containing protein [Saprospirales bacterium]|nr:DUF1573 domain-containing protein [Saprospirales bacterium]